MQKQNENDIRKWFTDLYEEQSSFLTSYALQQANHNPRVIQEVPDIIQQVFMLMFQKHHTLIHHPNIKGWLTATTKTLVSATIRVMQRYDGFVSFSLDDTEYERMEAELAGALNEQLKQINDKLTAIEETIGAENMRLLKDYYGYKIAPREIAHSLKITEDALRKRVSRLCDKIQQALTVLTIFLFMMSQNRL